jgi:DNA-binding CsgD family transcriptional regulator/PAS domain-containing protein
MFDHAATAQPPAFAMQSGGDVSALIGKIYDAALDPSRWTGALRMVAEFAGAQAVALFTRDAAAKTVDLHVQDGGLAPRFVELYMGDYVKDDPTTNGHCYGEIGKPVGIADLIDCQEYFETRLYKGWIRPQGLVDCLVAPLGRKAASTLLVGLFRGEAEGLCDDAMHRRVAPLVPHVSRAIAIGQAMESKSAEAARLADTLDGLSAGVFLVDDVGRLAHANASGRAMLAERSVLDMRGGKLSAREADANLALSKAFAAAAEGDAVAQALNISLPLSGRDGEPHMAHVLPLSGGARREAGTRHSAAAALFVRKARMDAPTALESLARQYALTPTELRVLLTLVETGGAPETAEALGIAVSTVKTHLHRLFAKTGTARQSDLVKLLAGYSVKLLR